MDGPQVTYTREEMDAILKLALERQQAKADGISREDLLAAAGEAGIPREDVEAAVREIDAKKAQASAGRPEPKERQESPTSVGVVDEARAYAVRQFWRRAITYGFVGLFVFILNLLTNVHVQWWPAAVCGLGLSLAIRATRLFFGDPADHKLSGRERRRMRREQGKRELQEHIEKGVDALVRAAYEARTMKPDERDTRGARVADPGVRVDPREEDPMERDDDERAPSNRARR